MTTTTNPTIRATLLTLTARAFARASEARVISNQNGGAGAGLLSACETFAHEAAAHANLYTQATTREAADRHMHGCTQAAEEATELAAEAILWISERAAITATTAPQA